MINISSRILKTCNKKTKLNLFFLLILIFISSIVEVLGISTIAPLIAVVVNEEIILENSLLFYFYNFFGFTSLNSFVNFIFIVFVLFIISTNILIASTISFLSYIAHNIERDMASKLYSSYIRADYLKIITRNSSEMIKNISAETMRTSHSVIIPILEVLSKLPLAILLLLIIFYLVPIHIFLIAGLVITAYLIIYYFIKEKLQKSDHDISYSLNQEIKILNESIDNIRELKLLNKFTLFDKRFISIASIKANARMVALILSRIPRYFIEMMFFILGAAYIYSMYATNTDILEIIPLLSIILLAFLRLLPVSNTIYHQYSVFQYNKDGFAKIESDLLEYNKNYETEVKNNKIFNKEKPEINIENGKIEFLNVNFSYLLNKNILKKTNLHIPIGSVTCLIGKSGSGKSTCLDLLSGLINPDSGEITINSINIQKIKNEWQNYISYVPQNSILMNDTILNNIIFNNVTKLNDNDYDRINHIIDIVELKDFIDDQEDGLNTIIGERGKTISGGQRQRISLARAIFRDPKIIILDEATNAIDEKTEIKIYENLIQLRKNITLLISTHKSGIVEKSNNILLFENLNVRQFSSWKDYAKKNDIFIK